MRWDKNYETGITEIDDQHKKLFEMVTHFYSALSEEKKQDALQELLKGLVNYTKYHFSTEEALMTRHGYMLSGEHLIEHNDFINKAADWQKRVASGQLLISLEVTNYLREWLIDHISKKDKQLGHYLMARGVN